MRPGTLTFVCISSILLGLMGFMACLAQVGGLYASKMALEMAGTADTNGSGLLAVATMQAATGDDADVSEADTSDSDADDSDSEDADDDADAGGGLKPGELPPQIRKQLEATVKVMENWQGPVFIMAAFHGIISFLLVLGGVLGFAAKPFGRTLMLAGFAGVILLLIGRFYPNYLMQTEMADTIREMTADVIPDDAAAPDLEAIQQMGATVQILFAAGWSLVIGGFSAWALFYLLRSKPVQYYFDPAAMDQDAGGNQFGLNS